MQAKPQTYLSHIDSCDYSANGQVVFLRIKLNNDQFSFKEGQFVMMQLPLGDRIIKRSYSICTTYSEYLSDQTIGFIIKFVPDGLASEYFFNQASIGDMMEIIGPLGHMILPEETTDKHFILISTGSGLSPIYGIFKKLLELDQYQSIIHLYGEKTQEWLTPETMKILTKEKNGIINKLCLSREPDPSLPNAFHGYVGQCLTQLTEPGALSLEPGAFCYLCGKPEIVEQLTEQLLGYGIPKEQIKSEKY